MDDILISSESGSYKIEFGILDTDKNNDRFYLVDERFSTRGNFPESRTVFLKSSEEIKNLSTVEFLCKEFSSKGMTKKNNLMVIGGGCIQDLGTLFASLYMRGIDWEYCPTTLAAMGDSCIGGKSSINAGQIKNLIGNFYPPKKILIDVSFCKTLPAIEILAGISEIIKICFAKSNLDFQRAFDICFERTIIDNPSLLEELVHLSLTCKKYFVEEDEFDSGVRKLLNFGHSFGHALESGTNYQIPHGVAVLIGMMAAVEHPASVKSTLTTALTKFCFENLKLVNREVQEPLMEVDYQRFQSALKSDKKNSPSDLCLVLPSDNGLELSFLPFSDGSLGAATETMKLVIGKILNEVC